jgi:hypothetical protein
MLIPSLFQGSLALGWLFVSLSVKTYIGMPTNFFLFQVFFTNHKTSLLTRNATHSCQKFSFPCISPYKIWRKTKKFDKSDIPSNFHDSLSRKFTRFLSLFLSKKKKAHSLFFPPKTAQLNFQIASQILLIENTIHTWTSCLRIQTTLFRNKQGIQIFHRESLFQNFLIQNIDNLPLFLFSNNSQ